MVRVVERGFLSGRRPWAQGAPGGGSPAEQIAQP